MDDTLDQEDVLMIFDESEEQVYFTQTRNKNQINSPGRATHDICGGTWATWKALKHEAVKYGIRK